MAYTLEISYYNSMILKPQTDLVAQPSERSASSVGYSNDVDVDGKIGDWHIEESRIKGGFNENSMAYGVKAFITDENFTVTHRPNALIYSGIFNSRTGINDSNQFSSGENITRAVDISHGSIQKLYAEDTNLIILQEDKVSRALIDKDAIFTAEGQRLSIQGQQVIGQIIPYSGRFGISKNPESFAVYGNRKYFSDKNRLSVIRLSQDGITPISSYGMNDFFRDNLSVAKEIHGTFDEHHKKYVICIKAAATIGSSSKTLSFDDTNNGWISFYSYIPNFGFSLNSKYYTLRSADIYEHYSNETRNEFYGESYPSTVDLIANQNPSIVKNFHTVNYEGTSGWSLESARTDSLDSAYPIFSNVSDVQAGTIPINFVRKEDKYYGHLRNNRTTELKGQVSIDVSGTKGFFNKIQMKNGESSEQELFSVSHEAVLSSN